MTWIERNPAVIGGYDGKNVIKSVEMLKNDKWIDMPPINIARGVHTSVCTQQNAWIIGGSDSENTLDSIERYEQDSWSVIKLRLPILASDIGICSLENNIIVFGGAISSNKDYINNVLLIDIASLRIIEQNLLPISSYFTYSSTFVDSEHIYASSHDSKESRVITELFIRDINC